jgi:hypothetical protein
MKTKQTIQDAIDANPEIRLILEIATRARETEARELPREIGSSTEVVAIPINSQAAV